MKGLGSKGQIRGLNSRIYLGRHYSKKNGLNKELI